MEKTIAQRMCQLMLQFTIHQEFDGFVVLCPRKHGQLKI
jgi:hypothetical protein